MLCFRWKGTNPVLINRHQLTLSGDVNEKDHERLKLLIEHIVKIQAGEEIHVDIDCKKITKPEMEL